MPFEKGYIPWNKGLTKNTDERVSKQGNRKTPVRPRIPRETRVCALPGCEETFTVRENSKRKYHTKECYWESQKGKQDPKKGKTYEEFYGEEKAKEVKSKCSDSHKGNVPSRETVEKREETKRRKAEERGYWHSEETKRKIGRGNEGIPRTEEWNKKNSEARKGKSTSLKGQKRPKSFSRMRSEIQLKLWEDPEYHEKQSKVIVSAQHSFPNVPETNLLEVLQKIYPNTWKYVGSGDVIIGGKNPDFISIDGRDKIIEMFGDYWHSEEVTGRTEEEEEKQRIDFFSKYGYQTLIVWQRELKDINSLKEKIRKFYSK